MKPGASESYLEMGAKAIRLALADAGIDYKHVQQAYAGYVFPRAVSIGMRLNDQIVENHTPHEQRQNSLYWFHVYEVVTRALDSLAYDVARWLNNVGFKAFPIPGSTPYNFDNLTGIISHKLVAHLAGSGWIGKSCLLLTEEFGPRVRFVSILTDAPLKTGGTATKK